MIPELIGFSITIVGAIIGLYFYKKSLPFLSKEQELYTDMELDRLDEELDGYNKSWRDMTLDEIREIRK